MNTITESKAYELFDNMLDECYPDYKLGYLRFTASQIMKELDPTAYRCEFNDWLNSENLEIEE